MSPRQIPACAIACWRQLRRALSAITRRAAQPGTQSDHPAAPANPASERGDARTRFWSEFRAGQREAEARATRRGA